MKRMLIFMLLVSFVASAEAADKLEGLKLKYELKLKIIERDSDKGSLVLENRYIGQLEILGEKMKKAGALDPLLYLQNEIKRFKKEKVITPESLSVDISEVRSLQANLMSAQGNLKLLKAKEIDKLATYYEESLLKLQKELTKAGDLTRAVAVKNERSTFELSPDVTAARLVIAEAEALEKEAKAKKEEEDKESEQAKKPVSSAKKKFTGTSVNRIRSKFKSVSSLMSKSSWDKAVEYVNPEYVEDEGSGIAAERLRVIFKFMEKKANMPGFKMSVESVDADEDSLDAVLTPKLFIQGAWRIIHSHVWVLYEGDWYIDIEGSIDRVREIQNVGGEEFGGDRGNEKGDNKPAVIRNKRAVKRAVKRARRGK